MGREALLASGTVEAVWDSLLFFKKMLNSRANRKAETGSDSKKRAVPTCPPALWGLLVRTRDAGVHVWLRVAGACSFFSFPLEFSGNFPNGRAGE